MFKKVLIAAGLAALKSYFDGDRDSKFERWLMSKKMDATIEYCYKEYKKLTID